MGLKLRLLAGIFALFAGLSAFADASSCLPEYNSLQAMQIIDMGAASEGEYALKSENASGIFVSKARMAYSFSPATHQLQLRFHWDDSAAVGLPYNVFSILILQNGAVAGWFDYTKECRDLGPGLFPGQSFSPPPVKLSGEGKQTFQFMVWGRIN